MDPGRRFGVALLAAVMAPAPRGHADTTASAGVGGGSVADRSVAAIDLGAESDGARWQLAVGARLRFDPDGLLARDWDEASEIARLVRSARFSDGIGDADLTLT